MVFILCACGSKNVSWQDKAEEYAQLEDQIRESVQGTDTFLADDYIDCLDSISKDLDSLKAGLSAEDDGYAVSLYTQALKLKNAAGLFSNEEAQSILTFAQDVEDLVIAAYDKASDFSDRKEKVAEELTVFESWGSEQWTRIEKRKKLSWAEVSADYEALKETVLEELPDRRNVTEIQLEEYKDTILNNYPLIADGVTDLTRKNADVIYEAAVALYEYTYEMNSVSADRVARFAAASMDYVMRAYGEDIADEYDFNSCVADASKWTLSLFNELTALMKMR